MSARKIVVCDDDPRRVQDWAEELRGMPGVADAYQVEPLTPAQFAAAFADLRERKATAAKGEQPAREHDRAAIIDQADLLVVDYDLTPRPGTGTDPSDEQQAATRQLEGEFGDTFSYLARAYATPTFIVLVNEGMQTSTFDLTMTRFSGSVADLNIAESDLDRPELWLGGTATGPDSDGGDLAFRPWHWPALTAAPPRVSAFFDDIELDEPVLGALGLDGDAFINAFTIDQLDVLSLKDEDIEPKAVTFRQVATSSSLGLPGRSDKQPEEALLARIAGAGVLRWLERTVLAAQNVLLDAPHLAERHPGLLPAFDEQPDVWNGLCRLDEPEPVIATLEAVRSELHPLSEVLSRPVWNATTAGRVARAATRHTSASNPPVFCEDVSAFLPQVSAHEFASGLPGPYRQRFVAQLSPADIDYRPRRRLLM